MAVNYNQIKSIPNCDISIRSESGGDTLVAKFKAGTVRLPVFHAERLNKENIHTIINQCRALPKPAIILARHINVGIAKQLHASNIQFIDLSGNVFIDSAPVYIFIKGEKQGRARPAISSPLSVAGIKVVFALLSNLDLESEPYRTIASASNVSLGSIDTIMRNLKHHHFLMELKDHERKLINKSELLKRWCIAFSERLESKLILARLSCDDKQWWKEVELNCKTAVWGGEVAAAKLTKYLKPEVMSIYADNALPSLQAKYGLKRSDYGEVIIYKRFWNFQSELDKHLAPKILIYAELMNSKDSRNVETAGIIYEKYLSKIIE